MTDELETLLRGSFTVPPGFAARVVRALPPRRPAWRERIEFCLLATGGALAASQVVAFIFGIWSVQVAG